MFNTNIGQIEIHNDSNMHLFLLLFPFVIFVSFFLLRKRIANSVAKNETRVSVFVGSLLIASGLFPYIDESLSGSATMSFGSIFANLNIYFSIIMGGLIMFRSYSLAKAFVPVAIILGLASIVNNPNDFLTTNHAINDIALATMPLMTIFLTKKNLSLKGLVLSLFVSFFVLATIFATKNISINSMDFSNEIHNDFYGAFKFETVQVMFFIAAALALQAIVFGIVRFVFTENKIDFLNEVAKETLFEKRTIASKIKQMKTAEVSSLEILLLETEYTPTDISDEELDVEKSTTKPLIQNVLIPHQIIRTRNSKGTRAPSL